MDRELCERLVKFIKVQEVPSLPCPYCGDKELVLSNDDLNYAFAPSDRAEKEIESNKLPTIDPYKFDNDIHKLFGIIAQYLQQQNLIEQGKLVPAKFLSFLNCNNCKEVVSTTGTALLKRDYYAKDNDLKVLNDEDRKKNTQLRFEYFSPPLELFHLNPHVPKTVRTEMLQAFNHFYSDPSSSGAKLRRALEKLCTELGYSEGTLHSSLLKMKDDHPREAELLMTLKLVGNEATHSDGVNEADLLDAFKVQEFVLKIFERLHESNILDAEADRLRSKFSDD